jgi:hypothetical protein
MVHSIWGLAGPCEHGNEPSGSIKGGLFPDCLSKYLNKMKQIKMVNLTKLQVLGPLVSALITLTFCTSNWHKNLSGAHSSLWTSLLMLSSCSVSSTDLKLFHFFKVRNFYRHVLWHAFIWPPNKQYLPTMRSFYAMNMLRTNIKWLYLQTVVFHKKERKWRWKTYQHYCRSVSIATVQPAGRRGFDSRQRQGFFSSPLRSDRLWG